MVRSRLKGRFPGPRKQTRVRKADDIRAAISAKTAYLIQTFMDYLLWRFAANRLEGCTFSPKLTRYEAVKSRSKSRKPRSPKVGVPRTVLEKAVVGAGIMADSTEKSRQEAAVETSVSPTGASPALTGAFASVASSISANMSSPLLNSPVDAGDRML